MTWGFPHKNMGVPIRNAQVSEFGKGAIMAIEAYCMKCKEKKTMKDPVESTTKNGKPITKGTCPDCGSTICRIGAAQ